jgi:hypothetical protein
VNARKDSLSSRWKLFLGIALLTGLILRLIYTEDMEWKEDEYYDFVQTQLIGHDRPWPWAGMNSGVYLANPGMSIWVFVWLARLARATDPIALQRALSLFAWLGIALLIPFALYFVKRGTSHQSDNRESWLWACAFAMVNPFGVYMDRKLWPQGFFPFFSTLMIAGWWKRDRAWGAFLWGCIGAMLGQIHMSGFFLAGALFLWTAFFNQKAIPKTRVRWLWWFIGSCAGAWPLIPWYLHVLSNPPPGQVLSGTWGDVLQFKFWVFWVTDSLGLHLGNPLGLTRGGSVWAQISDFVRYPIINGNATYLCGIAHAVALVSGCWIIFSGLFRRGRQLFAREARVQWLFARKVSQTAFAQKAALWGFGVLLTATRVNIRRYYMRVSFPFEQIWLVRLALSHNPNRQAGRVALFLLWCAQLMISAHFVGYIHVNQGSLQGDYGEAYHVIRDRHRAQTGESWPDLKLLPPQTSEAPH